MKIKKSKFSCPKCNRQQHFRKLFSINFGELTHCDYCKEELIPFNKFVPYNYLFGFLFGSISAFNILYLSSLPELLKFICLPSIIFIWMLYGYFSIVFYKQAGFDETLNH